MAHATTDETKLRRGTLEKLSSQQSGTLDELLTVAKLNTLGLAAYMSPEGSPGHDVIVVVDGQPKSIEVKTRQFLRRPTEITRWPVDIGKKGDADFFVFIELDLRTIAPTFYLLTNAQARAVHKDYGGGNCNPADVRRTINPNDFSALEPASKREAPERSSFGHNVRDEVALHHPSQR